MQLQAKRILVTGAAGGIGRRLCAQLAGRAASLGLLDRGPTAISTLVQDARDLHTDCIVIEADITSAEDRRRAVQQMNKAFGGIDILINLAGILDFRPFEEADPGMIAKILQVNVEAPMLLIREVLPQMTAQGSGRIVNIGSMFGSIAFPCFAAYSASKFALRGLSQALRREALRHRCGRHLRLAAGRQDALQPRHPAPHGRARHDAHGRPDLGRWPDPQGH